MNEHNSRKPAQTAVNGAVSHSILFIIRRSLDMPLRPHCRNAFDGTKWISVGTALERMKREAWNVTLWPNSPPLSTTRRLRTNRMMRPPFFNSGTIRSVSSPPSSMSVSLSSSRHRSNLPCSRS